MDQETGFTAEHWAAFLTHELGRPVHVDFGRARRQVIVARPDGASLRVRLNEHFATAPAPVRRAVAAWLRSGRRARGACALLDGWIEELAQRLAHHSPRRVRLEPQGRAHDLGSLRDELLERDFASDAFASDAPGPVGPPPVTWGRRGRTPARHSLQLGSFDPRTRVARVHRVLDQEAVPRFFVRSVLFHELLHAALPARTDRRGRTLHHGPEFRRRESAHRDFTAARRWQEENLAALLRSARTGAPFPRMEVARAVTGTQATLFPV